MSVTWLNCKYKSERPKVTFPYNLSSESTLTKKITIEYQDMLKTLLITGVEEMMKKRIVNLSRMVSHEKKSDCPNDVDEKSI